MELNSNLIKEFGHNMKVLGNALKDGAIDDKEAKACLKELTELIAACVRLKLYLLHSVGVRDYEPLYENKEVLHER